MLVLIRYNCILGCEYRIACRHITYEKVWLIYHDLQNQMSGYNEQVRIRGA